MLNSDYLEFVHENKKISSLPETILEKSKFVAYPTLKLQTKPECHVSHELEAAAQPIRCQWNWALKMPPCSLHLPKLVMTYL